jgi:ribosomal protein S19
LGHKFGEFAFTRKRAAGFEKVKLTAAQIAEKKKKEKGH